MQNTAIQEDYTIEFLEVHESNSIKWHQKTMTLVAWVWIPWNFARIEAPGGTLIIHKQVFINQILGVLPEQQEHGEM